MNLAQRIKAFENLSDLILDFLNNHPNSRDHFFPELEKKINEAFLYNGWFTRENIICSLTGITKLMNSKDLNALKTGFVEPKKPKIIAVIMAGNIPLVGFHDLLCVLLSGHKILIKCSSDDSILMPFLLNMLVHIEPGFQDYIHFSQNKLSSFDAVIATGSNNSSAYFEFYFGKYPNIIRKNRNSVAIITGKETTEDLLQLGKDIFNYFGLGCRNVSKLFVPKGYSFDLFFESIFTYSTVLQNKKYANNYEYNRAIYLMMQDKFLDNNFLLVKKEPNLISSPIGVIYYDEYESLLEAEHLFNNKANELQCIAGIQQTQSIKLLPFGTTQSPSFYDYADGIDVMAFLKKITLNN